MYYKSLKINAGGLLVDVCSRHALVTTHSGPGVAIVRALFVFMFNLMPMQNGAVLAATEQPFIFCRGSAAACERTQ